MSEPIVKHGRPERRTWQTGTSREFWELTRQRRYKEARVLVEERARYGDPEAHCEMARLRRDEGYPGGRKSHLESALLGGHPLAFALCFVSSDATDLTEVMVLVDPFHVNTRNFTSWAVGYVRQSGNALAEYILRRGMLEDHALNFDERSALQSRIMAEETSLAWILPYAGPAIQRKDVIRLAEYGVPEACYMAAEGGSWDDRSSGVPTRCSYAERQAWLIRAVEQGHLRSAEMLAEATAVYASNQLPWAARQLVATVRPHLNPHNTHGRWSLGLLLNRMCYHPSTPDLEREQALYCDFLCVHIDARPSARLITRHDTTCEFCEFLRKKPLEDVRHRQCLVNVLPMFLQKRDECKAATVALFGLIHRRKRMPRDIARFISKQVWDSRLSMPYNWGVPRDSSLPDIAWSPAVFLERK